MTSPGPPRGTTSPTRRQKRSLPTTLRGPFAGKLTGKLTEPLTETLGGLPGAYWWLWTSTLVNRLGGFVATFLTLYLTVQRGYSPSYAGLVAALYGLGGAAGAVVGGVLADRLGRRVTLLTSQLGAAALTASLALITHPAALAATAAGLGLVGNASRPATSAMIADLVRPEDRARAFSVNYWAVNIGFGVSAAAAGFIATVGYTWLFLGDAASTLLCALVVFAKVRETLPPPVPLDAAGPAPRPATLGGVLRDSRFMALVALTFLLGSVLQQGSSTLAVDMGASGLSTGRYGLVIGLNGLVIVLLQIPLTRMLRRHGSGTLLAAGSLLIGWGFGLTVLASSAGVYAVTVVVWTLGEIVHAPAAMAVVAEIAPADARGRYQGMYSLAWSGAAFAGPLAGGLALDHLGRTAVWSACAVLGTAAATGYATLLRPHPKAPTA